MAREAEILAMEREKGGEWQKYWTCREKDGCQTQKYKLEREKEGGE